MRLFVTGTDTNVGKTVACAALHWQLHAQQGGAYYKPLQTGDVSDSHTVKKLCTGGKLRIIAPRVVLTPPLAPYQAAQQTGVAIERSWFDTPPSEDNIIIEGAGGVMVPIARDFLYVHLMAQWQIPVVVVARAKLGTINHTLLTLNMLQQHNVPLAGFIFNGGARSADVAYIESYSGVPCLAQWPRCAMNSASVRTLRLDKKIQTSIG